MFLRAAAALTFAVMATACGGGVATVPLQGPSTSLDPPQLTARFAIALPAPITASSIVVTLGSVNGVPYTGSGAAVAINLSSRTPGCSGSPLTCTVAAPAAVGNDVFSVATFDAAQRRLSLANLTIAIVDEFKPLTIPLTLNGVIRAIGATFPVDAHISGSTAAGFTIVGNIAYTMTLAAVDASGATIVGAGAPIFAVTSAGNALAISTSGNSVTVKVKRFSPAPVNVTVTPSTGSAAIIAVTTMQELWVTDLVNNTVTGYLPGTTTSIDTIRAGLSNPFGLAFDANGTLWVANSSSNTVAAFLPGTNSPIAEDEITLGVGTPEALAFDAAGNLWVAGGNGIRAYVPGTNTPIAADTIPGGLMTAPSGLAFDASGKLWVTTANAGTVTAYVPGTSTPIAADTIPAGAGLSGPQGLAFDSNGILWVGNVFSNAVFAFTPGTATPIAAKTIQTAASTEGIAFDAFGNLWVVNSAIGHRTVTVYAPNGTPISTLTLTGATPTAIAFAP